MDTELFLRIFKHLLPRGRSFKITIVNKLLRQFFVGFSGWGTDTKKFYDNVYDDLYPQTTRKLDEWEEQFNLPGTALTEQQRRDRLDAAWKATGGQSPGYIQDVLRGQGFDVYVHESFDDPAGPPWNFRNPFTVLKDGSATTLYVARAGNADMRAGEEEARSGNITSLIGFALTNITSNVISSPALPADPNLWPFFVYIGGATFGDPATVSPARKTEFLNLCLKVCPTHLWIGVIVNFA